MQAFDAVNLVQISVECLQSRHVYCPNCGKEGLKIFRFCEPSYCSICPHSITFDIFCLAISLAYNLGLPIKQNNFQSTSLLVTLPETRIPIYQFLKNCNLYSLYLFQIGKCFRHPIQFGFPYDHCRRDYFHCKLANIM